MDKNEINIWEWDEKDNEELEKVAWKFENSNEGYRAKTKENDDFIKELDKISFDNEEKAEVSENKIKNEIDAVIEVQRQTRKKRLPLGITKTRIAATAVGLMLLAGAAFGGGYFKKIEDPKPALEQNFVAPETQVEEEDRNLIAEGQLDSDSIIEVKPSDKKQPTQEEQKPGTAQAPQEEKEIPELKWIGSFGATTGAEIIGPALIEKDSGWVKVYPGQTYTMSKDGHVNMYTGNVAGLEAEHNRVMKEWEEKQKQESEKEEKPDGQEEVEEKEEAEKVPELAWTGSFEGFPGTEVKGPALIEKDQGWVRVYPGETYTMQSTGNVNTYNGNNAGLDAEYNRVTEN